MPQPPAFSGAHGTAPKRKPRRGAGGRVVWRAAAGSLAWALALGLASVAAAPAQLPSAPSQPPSTASSSASDSGPATASDPGERPADDSGTSAASANPEALTNQGALSSGQIDRILDQNPDLIVDLKSLLATRLQEQGTQIDSNQISDEALYAQIAGSAGLRAGITSFLRARGYVSGDTLDTVPDVRENAAAGANEAADGEFVSARAAPSSTSLTSSERLAAEAQTGADFQRPGQAQLPENAARPSSSTRANPASRQSRSQEEVNASTDVPKVLRRPAPYNLQSMRDLYTQIPEPATPLKRFGSDVFIERDGPAGGRGGSAPDASAHEAPLDVPIGPDYVVGPGDTLTIDVWGGVTQAVTRAVDRDGRILLADAGSIDLAGLPLERAQALIEGRLKQQYRNAQVAVSVSHLRSVRVYVVGDVQRPGGYDISSLATPLSALYAAGGPTSVGSLRIARHYRGQQLVDDIDLYDFLLHGIRGGSGRFESGDTLLVPPAGAQIAVSGAVRRPAIYELKAGESTLATVVADAGGFTASASPAHIAIERIDANGQRETATLDLGEQADAARDNHALAAFQMRDGDRVRIAPILPYSQRAIYLEGHVVRPGRVPYSEGMRLSNVLRSYQDMLPEPAAQGEVVRLVPPDLHAETIDFNVPDVLIGNANLDLQPFDTVRIFGRYEQDAPRVSIQGEVLRPASYPLSRGMTAAQLVRMAGGFKRDALLESADLTSYGVLDGNRVAGSLATVPIGAAVAGMDAKADVPLKPGDVLTIHQITGWTDIGESVKIEGQVRFPGTYGFQEGERLSSVLQRAGGLRDTAYPEGAVLVRRQVRDLEETSRQELIRQIQSNSAATRISPSTASGDAGATLQLIKTQQDDIVQQLRNHPPAGRLVVHISPDIKSWANTPADIELRRDDVLTIPKRPGFVLVTGQVYNATAITFAPGKTADWYLSHAGGANTTANRKEIFIIRANGSVIGRRSSGWFNADVLSTRLDPGDVVVVPQKILSSSAFWRNLLTTAQLASSIAITASVASL